MGGTLVGLRAQASLEYLVAFAAALGIMVAAGYVLLGVGSSVGNLAPASCSFDLGVNCQNIAFVSNSSTTTFAFLGNNEQQYPITGIKLDLFVTGQSVVPQCTTGQVNPGETFVCFAEVTRLQNPGSKASGNMTASVGYCGLSGGSCSGGQINEKYAGRYSSPVGAGSAQIGFVFSKPYARPDGGVLVNVSFSLLGYSVFLAAVNITPHSGGTPGISYSGPGSPSLNISASTLADYCAALVNVTYANMSGTYAVALDASNYTKSSFKLASNSNSACYSLAAVTKSVSISGQNNTAGVFLLSNVSINDSSTGGYNNLAVFNSTATVKIAGNDNNVTFFASNVALTITGTYNRVKLINSRVSNLTASGNNNLIILSNTTIAQKDVTGTNDIIEAS